ncbi:spidroin-1-like [Saccostrea cucullata]|uniref:spidroin-1-like n=1 Tax=Saccostrea cuccullata TaxID=36930 RepID=UPI002ED1291F
MRCYISFVLLAWMLLLLCEFNAAQNRLKTRGRRLRLRYIPVSSSALRRLRLYRRPSAVRQAVRYRSRGRSPNVNVIRANSSPKKQVAKSTKVKNTKKITNNHIKQTIILAKTANIMSPVGGNQNNGASSIINKGRGSVQSRAPKRGSGSKRPRQSANPQRRNQGMPQPIMAQPVMPQPGMQVAQVAPIAPVGGVAVAPLSPVAGLAGLGHGQNAGLLGHGHGHPHNGGLVGQGNGGHLRGHNGQNGLHGIGGIGHGHGHHNGGHHNGVLGGNGLGSGINNQGGHGLGGNGVGSGMNHHGGHGLAGNGLGGTGLGGNGLGGTGLGGNGLGSGINNLGGHGLGGNGLGADMNNLGGNGIGMTGGHGSGLGGNGNSFDNVIFGANGNGNDLHGLSGLGGGGTGFGANNGHGHDLGHGQLNALTQGVDGLTSLGGNGGHGTGNAQQDLISQLITASSMNSLLDGSLPVAAGAANLLNSGLASGMSSSDILMGSLLAGNQNLMNSIPNLPGLNSISSKGLASNSFDFNSLSSAIKGHFSSFSPTLGVTPATLPQEPVVIKSNGGQLNIGLKKDPSTGKSNIVIQTAAAAIAKEMMEAEPGEMA